jgi:uncharacterized protein with FMN-binding domain/ferredoxin
MNSIKTRFLRTLIQASVFLVLITIIVVYNLYIEELINIKLSSIGDLNPYGGWNAIREFATDSGYIFEGISKSMALTIALVAMGLIGGRYFCGWLCPLGALQDLAAWLGTRCKTPKYKGSGKNKFNPVIIKYPILLSIIIISILGYGAIIANLSPWRALLSLPKITSAWPEMKIGFIILSGIFLASLFLSRFFCRYLCPLGAAQALFSSFSLLSMKGSKGCTGCNKCLIDCPVGIKLSSESDTNSPECIRCMNCLETCAVDKDNGIHLKAGNKNVSVTAYIILMLILFTVLWLGLPQLWDGSQSSGYIVPNTLKSGTYQGEAKGFAGKIITEIYITEGKITDIKVIKHQESKGWYEEVYMMLPREIISKQRLQVDAISGATKTSKGLIKSIENALKKAK